MVGGNIHTVSTRRVLHETLRKMNVFCCPINVEENSDLAEEVLLVFLQNFVLLFKQLLC